MKTLKLLGIGLVASTTFFMGSCKKYEEGPLISLKSKKERMSNTWVIEKALRNGADVTSDYDQYEFYLAEDGDSKLSAVYRWGDLTYVAETDGTWNFQNDKKELNVDYKDDGFDQEYQILKLKDDELWIRVKGGEDELHLMPK